MCGFLATQASSNSAISDEPVQPKRTFSELGIVMDSSTVDDKNATDLVKSLHKSQLLDKLSKSIGFCTGFDR